MRSFDVGRKITRSLLALLMVGTLFPANPMMARPPTASEKLDAAIDTYEHGSYLQAASQLTSLLYPLKLTDRPDIVQAKVYLGLCYYLLGRTDDAEEEFRGVFRIDARYQPDPLYIPPEISKFIETLRPEPPRTATIPGLGEEVVPGAFSSRTLSPVDLLPFGVPQFRRHDKVRARVLLVTESSFLALNIGSYWFLRTKNTRQFADSYYPLLLTARAINISSLGLLAVAVVAGAGDAVYRYGGPPVRESGKSSSKEWTVLSWNVEIKRRF